MTKNLAIDSGVLAVPAPDASGVCVYKGIPYAAPPIGRLRWRPPEPAAAWTGVRSIHEFGAHSVQGVAWDDIDLSGAATSEDCLHLNVWTPVAQGTDMIAAVFLVTSRRSWRN
jgi:para-nitrobenzyl esterase